MPTTQQIKEQGRNQAYAYMLFHHLRAVEAYVNYQRRFFCDLFFLVHI